MSNFEWCYGEVVVPAAQLAVVRRTLRHRHNERVYEAYDALKRFRVAHNTTSVAKWAAAIAVAKAGRMTGPLRLALRVAKELEKPRAVKWADFDHTDYSIAEVTRDVFPLYTNDGLKAGEINFHQRVMTWEVYRANHAVDDFQDSDDSFFLYEELLEPIRWLRGSGGGESYGNELEPLPLVSRRYGPLGRKYVATSASQEQE